MSISKYDNLKESGRGESTRDGYVITPSNDTMVISYLSLRRTIGAAGMLFPIIMILGSFVSNENILPSLSHYFHSSMKIIFVGFIFAIAFFLYSYVGEEKDEKYICKIASIAAILLTLLPTDNDLFPVLLGNYYTYNDFEKFTCPSLPNQKFVGILHFVAALIFFTMLIYLILINFVKSETKSTTPIKYRILIYKICGYGMILCIISIAVCIFFFTNSHKWTFPPTFTFESIALFLFGLAWTIKGETFE